MPRPIQAVIDSEAVRYNLARKERVSPSGMGSGKSGCIRTWH